MTFGQRLRYLRELKEVTQAEVGKIIGMSARMISFYEKDIHFPKDANSLISLADYFNVSTDYLLGCTEVRNYKHLSSLFKVYTTLSSEGKQLFMDYIKFLKTTYKNDEN